MIRGIYRVWCDQPGCTAASPTTPFRREARRVAKAAGWTRRKRAEPDQFGRNVWLDTCPGHTAPAARPGAPAGSPSGIPGGPSDG